MDVLIGIPTRGKVEHGVSTFISMSPYVHYFSPNTISVETARIDICNHFLLHQYDYLFFLDDDVVPPDGCIDKLVSYNKEIISANYPILRRDGIHSNCHIMNDYMPYDMDGLSEVDVCGLGACLIARDVIAKAIERGGFDMQYEVGGLFKGEDVAFCDTVKALGYKIYCDFSLKCEHIKKVSLKQMCNFARERMII